MNAKLQQSEGIAITVRNLDKKYKLYDSPKDRIKEALNPFNRIYHRDFWALRDLSFEVPKGSTVGILGRNGSGKSTLLQILASVLVPTQGDVHVNGTVSALLELGAGFNPEFSGRSNAIFSGMLLGLSEQEMRSKLPEIEAFAQIGEFIDQPVKVYSSGMFVRLAFATAVNVDPDILLIDEAIAVGDTKFQQRCFDRLHEFQDAGKTIIFVTHDIESVLNHADMAMLMHEGRLIDFGEPITVSNSYREILMPSVSAEPLDIDIAGAEFVTDAENAKCSETLEAFRTQPASMIDLCPSRPYYNENETSQGGNIARVVDIFVTADNKPFPTFVSGGSWVDVHIKIAGPLDDGNLSFGFHLRTLSGSSIYGINSNFKDADISVISVEGGKIFTFSIQILLNSGHYSVDLGVFRSVGEEILQLHVRRQLLILPVINQVSFDGLVDLFSTQKQ